MSWCFFNHQAGREGDKRTRRRKKRLLKRREEMTAKEKVFTCDGWYGYDPTPKYEFRSSKSIMERASSPEPPCSTGGKILL
jgi:hypothetical protein